jgi:hypothetical protein
MKSILDTVIKLKFVFLIVVLFASLVQISCSPQTETKMATEICEIELKDLPPFRGLKIGMPLKLEPSGLPVRYQTDSLNSNKGQEIDNVEELGYIIRTVNINNLRNGVTDIKLPVTIDTKDLKLITLVTFDGNLVRFRLEYDENMKSPSVEDAIEKLADAVKLPRGSFSLIGTMSVCYCKDFIVNIFHKNTIALEIFPNYESTFSNRNISKILIERDKERTLKRENSFTP